ncbi:protein-glutamate O-methyltransferase CheR [Vagococcus sp. BWB3-3]|uniref:protein-glutamate O-methyltransferase n=1 Tax=Vagococcus allomyrinae TaxID=2794353 RepID=A0A940PBP3_9ENTE|nr:protein-glutamate O-methyltransferase CheR [Vagococcus allomyrinae]MBP1042024.1 protein-glutamate O-methyltransferase CheR [Vagococcus allomyrinae]
MDVNFDEFYQWVKDNLGIELAAYKEKQLQRRILSVMRNSGAKTLLDYTTMISHQPQIKSEFLDYITINVTEFFRNPDLFREFENQLVEQLSPQFGRLKIWSAACSVGAEPYSLAILVDKRQIKLKERILATDIDHPILGKAKAGIYKESELKNVSAADRLAYFKVKEDVYHLAPQIKQNVLFKQHDLLQSPFDSEFHAIICRNVTIYFKNDARDNLYRKFHDALVPGGLFFTGATETINNPESIGFKKISTFIYQKQ